MTWSTSSQPNKLLFWSFVVLAIVMVIAVALALRSFNREMGEAPESPPSTTGNETSLSQGDAHMTPEELEAMMALNRRSLSGFVSEVIATENTSEKWIILSVELPESIPTAMPSSGTATKTSLPVETVMRSYRFYLGAKAQGAGDIQGGETANVSFFGEPSEKEYVGAETIAIREE